MKVRRSEAAMCDTLVLFDAYTKTLMSLSEPVCRAGTNQLLTQFGFLHRVFFAILHLRRFGAVLNVCLFELISR